MESVYGKYMKSFFSGGEEYRIYLVPSGLFYELYRWQTDYDYVPTLLYQEDSMEAMYEHEMDIYEANADYDLNL